MYRLLLVLILMVGSDLLAQNSVLDNSTPAAILMNSLNAAGGTGSLFSIRDFKASGQITYYWAGEAVQGAATVLALGVDNFRLDANLPEGIRTLILYRIGGVLKAPDGKVKEIPLHNTINLGIPSFPHIDLLTALSDSQTEVSMAGTAIVNNRATYQVRVQRKYPKEFDSVGMVNGLCKTDYYIDVATGVLLKTLDMTHPDYTLTEDFVREMEFDDYVTVKGMSLPSLIREKIVGQTIWELRLSDISFNIGLSDSDFSVRQ